MFERPASLLVALMLGGCVPKIGELPPSAPSLEVPSRWQGAPEGASAATDGWAKFFADPTLVQLIDTAVRHNQELGIQLQETRISNAAYVARRGEYLPRLGLGAGVGLERVGKFTSQGASDAADDIEPGRKVPENLADFKLAGMMSWEVDVWMRLRNASRAAQLRYFASVEGRNFAVTGVVAEVASTYYELLALDERIRVIDENIRNLTDSLAIARLQRDAARATSLAVQRFEAELLDGAALRQSLLMERSVAENRLNQLCGRWPQTIDTAAGSFDRATAPPMPVGTPQALLENRPDVRAAELQLEASKLEVKSARAAFYPSLGIDAEAGWNAFTLSRLPSPESLMFGVAGGVLAPLVNRSELKGEYLAANAEQAKAILAYERAVIGAFTEVGTQRARLERLTEGDALRQRQVETMQTAAATATELFRHARLDYLEVLTTRRDALEAEMQHIETRLDLLQARIGLYAALGGGWHEAALPEPSRADKRTPKDTP